MISNIVPAGRATVSCAPVGFASQLCGRYFTNYIYIYIYISYIYLIYIISSCIALNRIVWCAPAGLASHPRRELYRILL
jgi:hypothetical protein